MFRLLLLLRSPVVLCCDNIFMVLFVHCALFHLMNGTCGGYKHCWYIWTESRNWLSTLYKYMDSLFFCIYLSRIFQCAACWMLKRVSFVPWYFPFVFQSHHKIKLNTDTLCKCIGRTAHKLNQNQNQNPSKGVKSVDATIQSEFIALLNIWNLKGNKVRGAAVVQQRFGHDMKSKWKISFITDLVNRKYFGNNYSTCGKSHLILVNK